jgi:hypothetical protein
MCIEIFLKPCLNEEQYLELIDVHYPVGGFEDRAHIFACVYKILTTFYIKEESSTTTKSFPDEDKTKGVHIFAFVHKLLTTFHVEKKSSTATKSLPDEVKTKGVHIFAFVYKILTTFHINKELSTATKSLPDEDKTKESASDREQLPQATSFGNYPTVLDIRKLYQSIWSNVAIVSYKSLQSRRARLSSPFVILCLQYRTNLEGI